MQSLDVEKQRDAISAAITAIYKGPKVPEEIKTRFKDAMEGLLNVILYPLTSTQLGVFSNFLDMKKIDVLEAVDSRAKEFKEKFLDFFVPKEGSQDTAVIERSKTIAEINEAKQARRAAREKNFDSLMWDYERQDEWEETFREYMRLSEMERKSFELRELFREELKKNPLTELPSDVLHRVMRNNPRFVAGISHTFNLLGTVAATYSVFREIFTADSGFRQGDPRSVLTVVATTIGGVGSVKGTYDLAKVLKDKLFQPRSPR